MPNRVVVLLALVASQRIFFQNLSGRSKPGVHDADGFAEYSARHVTQIWRIGSDVTGLRHRCLFLANDTPSVGMLWQKNPPIQNYWDHSPLKYFRSVRTRHCSSSARTTRGFQWRNPWKCIERSERLVYRASCTSRPTSRHDRAQPKHQLHKMNTEMEWS